MARKRKAKSRRKQVAAVERQSGSRAAEQSTKQENKNGIQSKLSSGLVSSYFSQSAKRLSASFADRVVIRSPSSYKSPIGAHVSRYLTTVRIAAAVTLIAIGVAIGGYLNPVSLVGHALVYSM